MIKRTLVERLCAHIEEPKTVALALALDPVPWGARRSALALARVAGAGCRSRDRAETTRSFGAAASLRLFGNI
jgi:hypothetical protein